MISRLLSFSLLGLLLISGFLSCAHKKHNSKLEKFSSNMIFDPMQSESIERFFWDEKKQAPYPESLVLCYQGKTDQGLQKLKLMSAGKEADANYWNMVGSCYYWNKEYQKAKFYFELGLTKNENHIDLLHNVALVELMQGRLNVALKSLNDLVQKDPSALLARWNLALIYYTHKSPELAINHLKTLLTSVPNDPLISLILIKSYVAMEQYQSAIDSYANIPSQHKAFTEFQNIYAYVLTKMGKIDEAQKVVQEKIHERSDKNDKEFRSALKNLIEQLQKAKEKTNSVDRGVAKDPEKQGGKQ